MSRYRSAPAATCPASPCTPCPTGSGASWPRSPRKPRHRRTSPDAWHCGHRHRGRRAGQVCVRGRWREPTNLYTAIALDPGNRKSAVFALMTEPLMAVEKRSWNCPARPRQKPRQPPDWPRRQRTRQPPKPPTPNRACATNSPPKPARSPRLPRKQGALQAAARGGRRDRRRTSPLSSPSRSGRISVMSPEGGIFDIIAGRYSGAPNMEVFLKGHAGDMVRVNRQGRDAEYIEHPAVTMGLAVQPEVLESIGAIKGAAAGGCSGASCTRSRNPWSATATSTPDLIPDEVAATYAQHLGGLAMALAGWTDPALLTLAPEADAAMLAYQKVTEARIGKGGPLGDIARLGQQEGRGHGPHRRPAAPGRPPRGRLRNAPSRPRCSPPIELGEYFTSPRLAVFDAMGADPAQEGRPPKLLKPT